MTLSRQLLFRRLEAAALLPSQTSSAAQICPGRPIRLVIPLRWKPAIDAMGLKID
jgi:hypothetical protein